MNVQELIELLVRSHDELITEHKGEWTDYEKGTIAGIEFAVRVANRYQDEAIERMAEHEEIYVETAGSDPEQ